MADNNELNEQSQYCCGPYVVFDDDSTYAWAEDAYIALLTQEGEDKLDAVGDFKAVDDDDVVCVTLGELIAAYNRWHGTKL